MGLKYLGKEFEVIVRGKREIEYIRCDMCNKKMLPSKFLIPQSSYFRIHTWHDDWGNDSVESHEYKDLCADCAKSFVERFMDNASGSDQMELSYEHLSPNETVASDMVRDFGFKAVSDDLSEGGAE